MEKHYYKDIQMTNSYSYSLGSVIIGTAPNETITPPMAYTIDKYKMVRNLPNQLSATIAPTSGHKYTNIVNT